MKFSKKGEDEKDEDNRKLSKNKYFTYRDHSTTKKIKSCSKLPLFESFFCLRPFHFNHLDQKKVWFNEKIS